MAKAKHILFGIHITDRMRDAAKVQTLLSEYGCEIRTRLGLHEASEDFCSPSGIVVLEMTGDEARIEALAAKLAALSGLELQRMVFDHP